MDNKSALVQAMAWHQMGEKLLAEPKMTHFIEAYKHHHSLSVSKVISPVNTLAPGKLGWNFR